MIFAYKNEERFIKLHKLDSICSSHIIEIVEKNNDGKCSQSRKLNLQRILKLDIKNNSLNLN